MAEHTPTPWQIGIALYPYVHFYGPSDKDGAALAVGSCVTAFGKEYDEANASFIIKAVNNHDALAAVRRTFLGYLQAENGCKRSGAECREKCACELELQGLVEAWGGAVVGALAGSAPSSQPAESAGAKTGGGK